MASSLQSPGVLARENDQSQITDQPIQAGAAIIGPTVKGRVNRPKLVTSYSQYKALYGSTFTSGSNEYTFLTSISAYNYFSQGGTSLLVTRVASGSFTPATSDNIQSGVESGVIDTTSDALLTSLASVTGSAGTYNISGSSSGTGVGFTGSITLTGGATVSTITATNAGSGYSIGEIITITSQSIGYGPGGAVGTNFTITLNAGDIVNSSAFTLETFAEGTPQNSSGTEGTNNTLTNGTKDNLRWEIVSPNTSSGTFSLLIRRGNDNINSKVVLESYNNLSLDPNQDNYISKIVGDMTDTVLAENGISYLQTTGSYSNKSNYVRVKSITNTINYFDNAGVAKTALTASIPLAGSGSFSGATGTITPTGRDGNYYQSISSTDTQGVVAGDYTTALSLLNNKDEYKYNFLTAPGITAEGHSTVTSTMVSQAQTRGDYLAVIDLCNYNSTVTKAINGASNFDNSYAATYWPWVQTSDPDTGDRVWVPASTIIPSIYAYNDRVAATWFAPAGINRGVMGTVSRAERKLIQTNRDDLYTANVNPIATLKGRTIVFGQKTLQKKASALDRVNVRRLLITLKDYISQIADTLVFEQNTIATRSSFLSQVNPYLQNVQQQQGLYTFKVVMDDSNNTPDVIDRNELVGQIFLQPTKTAEFIILDFNVTPTGATF